MTEIPSCPGCHRPFLDIAEISECQSRAYVWNGTVFEVIDTVYCAGYERVRLECSRCKRELDEQERRWFQTMPQNEEEE